MRRVALCAAVLAASAAMPAYANQALASKYGCLACHVVKGAKTVGPAYADVAKKYAGKKDAVAHLMDKVRKGGSGVWGQVPMPPNPSVPDADLKAIVTWVLSIK
jgi:cytochrome c